MGELKLVLKEKKNALIFLFLSALAIRLAFSFYFQQFYFGELTFKHKDTSSYLLPILNLFEHGVYQGDLFLEDSKFFRVPVYPFFLGLVHLIFGANNFDYALAVIQSVLDSSSVVLIYLIVYRISQSKTSAWISALVYATYPFVILWVPISYTETVQIFLMWLLITHLLYFPASTSLWIVQGILCGLLILTKQYMGLVILIPAVCLFLTGNFKARVSASIALLLGVLVILTPWATRNYLQSGELIVLRGETTGLRSVGIDLESFYKFATLFNENVTPALYEVAYHGKITLTKHPEFVKHHKEEINEAVSLAYQCGDSFVQNRLWVPLSEPPFKGCADKVAERFDNLTRIFWRDVPLTEGIETRIDAAAKILTKGDVVNKSLAVSKSSFVKDVLFKYRVFILVIGLVGLILLIRQRTEMSTLPIFITAGAMYAYFTVVIVHAEMRYLLIPDLLISVFAGITAEKVYVYLKNTPILKMVFKHEV